MDKTWTVETDSLIRIVVVFVPHECGLKEVMDCYEGIGLRLESHTVGHKGHHIVFRRDWYG